MKTVITVQIFESLNQFICPLFIFKKKNVNSVKNSWKVHYTKSLCLMVIKGSNAKLRAYIQYLHDIFCQDNSVWNVTRDVKFKSNDIFLEVLPKL